MVFGHPFGAFFPGEWGVDGEFFPTRKLIGAGDGFEVVDPFFLEEVLDGLSGQAADGVVGAVEGDSGFGCWGAEEVLAGGEVFEGDGGGVGEEAEDAACEAVFEGEFAAIFVFGDAGLERGGVDHPIGGLGDWRGGLGDGGGGENQNAEQTSH